MKIHTLIYRKQMILLSLRSMGWEKPKIDWVMQMCNADKKFMKMCVRTYRGSCSITKRIERIRSGNKRY